MLITLFRVRTQTQTIAGDINLPLLVDLLQST